MKKSNISILLSLLALILASLACTTNVGGPDYPNTPIPVSTEAIGDLNQQVEAAQTAAAETGVLSFSITESQLTSLVAAKLSSQSEQVLTNPQVYLRDGTLQIYGKAVKGNFEANIRVVVTITLDSDGKPVVTITSADFGPLPAPEGLNTAITALVDEAFTGMVGPAATGFRLESVAIADGVMTITGKIK